MSIHWQAWHADVARQAQADGRCVLLFLVADWCVPCGEMERATFGDRELAGFIADHVVPVKIDVEAQPELATRFGRGGWPTTLVLAGPDDVVTSGTWFGPDELLAALRLAERRMRGESPVDPGATADGGDEGAAPRGRQPSGRLDESILPAVEDALLSHFDERHGGFGGGPKFPHPEAIDFAILRHAGRADPRLHAVIEKTLTHMAESPLRDHVDGGFFRYASERDWRRPHTEKRLEVQAGLLRNYLEAGQLMQRADFLDLAGEIADAMLRDFRDEQTGLFHASLDPDDEYYALDAAGRRTRKGPRRDGRFLADANARAVSALLKAGCVLRRQDLTDVAVAIVDSLLDRLWRRGRGMFHYDDGSGPKLPGRLRDQAETARAVLHVLQYTADRRYVGVLDDLLERIASDHATAGGDFADRDVVAGQRPLPRNDTAINESSAAAEVLLRGALCTGRSSLAELARRALAVHTTDFRRYGYGMAAFGRSVELVLHPPLHILVVGAERDQRTLSLLASASETYLPSRVVQHLDPVDDEGHLRRLGLPIRDEPAVYVCLLRDWAEHRDPHTLPAALLSANGRRLAH